MDLIINHGILHIIDNERGQVAFSSAELDLDSDMVADFLTKHIKKIMNSTAVKEATFNNDSQMLSIVCKLMAKETDFKQASIDMCKKLSEIMLENGGIPPADILIAQFDIKHDKHLAIFKLNHSVFYTHETKGGENHIVQSAFALPLGNSKVSEAVLIPYSPMVLKIIEKPHIVNGEEANYFSEHFLDAGTQLSKKEAARIVKDILEGVVDEFEEGNPMAAAKFHLAMIEEAIENDGDVRLESVCRQAFENDEARSAFIEAAKEAGMGQDYYFGEKFCMKEFGTIRVKSSDGIELKLPVGIMDDPNIAEIKSHGAGFDILVKNLSKS